MQDNLRQNYVPSVYPARKVPQSQKQKLKKELDRLVQTEVLVKAERPTDWVLPLVIVEKPNGDLRLCLDPMDLNEYIRREHYHLPHRSEILRVHSYVQSLRLSADTPSKDFHMGSTVHQKYSMPRFSNCSRARQESKSSWMT